MQNFKKASPADSQPESSTDTVEISSNTALMTEAEERVSNTPDINQETIEKVRRSLQNGEMKIDFERLAQKMLDFELTLFDS